MNSRNWAEGEMARLTDAFPDQLLHGFRTAQGLGSPLPDRPSPFVVGMGGSGIAGDILQALASAKGQVPIFPVRSFDIPSWAGKGTPAIFVSYSGDTAETLLAYDRSEGKGFARAVVTSGGALLERAQRDGVPAVVVPGGNPPRASLGYLFGALYGLLEPVFSGRGPSLTACVEDLRRLGPGLRAPGGPADRVARAWGPRDLWIYVPERLAPVGRRWMTQAAENAKRLAHYDTLTEALHNAVVPWDLVTREAANARCVVMVSGGSDLDLLRSRAAYLSEILERVGSSPVHVRLTSSDPLTEILEGAWMADYASLMEAALTGVDPMPIPALERMKARHDA